MVERDGFVEPDFKLLFESAPGLYLVLTPDFRICGVSDAYLLATMTERSQIVGRGIFDVFPDNPDDPSATGVRHLRDSLESVLRTKRADTMAVQKYDIRRPEAEGGGFEERFWSPRNSPVTGRDGVVRYIVHRVEDVTEFVRLQRIGSELEKVTETLQSRAGRMESEIYQRSQELGEANRQLRSLNDGLGRLYDKVAALMNESDVEVQGRNAGERVQAPLDPEEMLARVERLISTRNDLEEQLRQGRKMEAVGRLAGGVAHDFNNLLTVILGYADLAIRSLPDGPTVDRLKGIANAASRAAALTAQLLAFSRKQILQPKVVECNRVMSEMESLLRRVIPENVTLIMVLGSATGRIRVDRTQMEQVIMNLSMNARDAMPDGGRLTIETRSIEARSAAHVRALPDGEYALISFTDTGHGIDAETATHIFEPFFTTKDVGKGTGLGLSTVHGIVEQSGGTVTVESSPGAGAIFRVFLPKVEGDEDTNEVAPNVRVVTSLGSVLIVEDEPAVRELVGVVLTDAGFHVLEAANGDEALLLAKSHRFDLLLADIVMPGMSGPELVKQLRSANGDFTALFMSGYDRDSVAKTVLPDAAFLPKPFSAQELLSKVSQLIAFHRDKPRLKNIRQR